MHGFLNLHCYNTDYFKLKSNIVESFYKTKVEEHFQKVISKYKDFYNDDVVFKIRKMKTRWGSCKPKKAIEYLVLHEITHLKYNNHDFGFYNYLSAYMAD